jgi:hypothetical protein
LVHRLLEDIKKHPGSDEEVRARIAALHPNAATLQCAISYKGAAKECIEQKGEPFEGETQRAQEANPPPSRSRGNLCEPPEWVQNVPWHLNIAAIQVFSGWPLSTTLRIRFCHGLLNDEAVVPR